MARILCLVIVLTVLVTVSSPDARAAGKIDWKKTLAEGLQNAKDTDRVLLICINAKTVQGEKIEPAAKGLREIVYLDDRIVKRSRDFVCVMLTPTSSSTDYAELTALGIGGEIISPQHIFVNSAGTKVLLRKEYWSHGSGEKAVEKLLELMVKAEERAAGEPEAPEGAGPQWLDSLALRPAPLRAAVPDPRQQRCGNTEIRRSRRR